MAKNKNRKQGGPQNRASQPGQAHERAQRPSEEHESSMAGVPGGPADGARKKQQRFGHN
ncbi:hypothetical protein GCM10010503_51230 [Streptomyces lucensis JCM 4490]|uniref:Uncharacterized protein n=1 Tax=Streptomyces lucensis JCM 4490 TaxID=1306176 RepID=A0A918MTP3_9ACTN|nr:hypothetical protein [Streptomyces lucensis]GGW67746.1 hypothetical protein GCM10010503_51230 [Streptomyces lucensis JCM 4490]